MNKKRLWINTQTGEIFEGRKEAKEKYGTSAFKKMQNLGIIRYIEENELNKLPYYEQNICKS